MIIEDGNITQKIKIDENDDTYLSIKKSTNNFTKNMIELSKEEEYFIAFAELDAQREKDKLEQQLALAELAEALMGGEV